MSELDAAAQLAKEQSDRILHLENELKDSNYWRVRNSNDAKSYGEQSQRNWKHAESLKKKLEELKTALATKTDKHCQATDKLAMAILALRDVKIRICFIGHPKEKYQKDGTPDWSRAISAIEGVLTENKTYLEEWLHKQQKRLIGVIAGARVAFERQNWEDGPTDSEVSSDAWGVVHDWYGIEKKMDHTIMRELWKTRLHPNVMPCGMELPPRCTKNERHGKVGHAPGSPLCEIYDKEDGKKAAICENCEKSHETEYYPHPIDASLCKKCFGQYGKADSEEISKTCEEASTMSRDTFIPCGAPATRRILSERGKKTYSMCAGCASHNVRNRGCEDVGKVEAG